MYCSRTNVSQHANPVTYEELRAASSNAVVPSISQTIPSINSLIFLIFLKLFVYLRLDCINYLLYYYILCRYGMSMYCSRTNVSQHANPVTYRELILSSNKFIVFHFINNINKV
jgi:hypothetical protein